LLCGIGGYLVLTTGAAREQAFVSGYTVMPRDPVAANVQTVDIRQTVEELRSEIPMLEQEIAMLTHRIEDKKFEFQQARRELHTSQEDLERINRELKELRAELGRKNMELRKARVQFQTFAPPEEPAAQSEPTTPVEKQ
jgi:septal ring factor EnvC (AmiA/AmiB activator)